jgi:hypothetical protein
MSSTNRKNAKARHVSDYYVTPKKDIRDFFSHWLEDLEDDFLSVKHNLDNLIWLDPCAGGDEKNDMSYPAVLINDIGTPPANITTYDIREDSRADNIDDFLLTDFEDNFDIVISNPPFNLAEQFIRRSLEAVQPEGYVIMLLRLNFLGSKARKTFWDTYPPQYIYVHHKRLSFTENGATDSIEYAHFVWQKGNYPSHAKLKVI